MKNIRKVIKNILKKTGYTIQKISKDTVNYDNFSNLVTAYEYSLNEKENLIQPNTTRIKLISRLAGTLPSEAFFIIQSLAKTKCVDGDVCEFGVAQGETSTLIANEISSGNKKLHLFDSFQGLPSPTEKDLLKDDIFSLGDMKNYSGTMSFPEDMVLTRLKNVSFPNERLVIHKGFIEESIKTETNLPTKVSFAYVDFDFYEPIKIALEYLHKNTDSGSVIIVDDYDFFSTGAKTAVDEFISDKNASSKIYECIIPEAIRYGCFAVITKI